MALITRLQPLFSALYLLGILHLLFFSHSEGTASGFTTHLIHRDSPLSPFYKPSSTHFDRLHDALKRSLKRVNHFRPAIHVPLKPGWGEFLMKMSLGTPPVEVFAEVDTGSDLIWTQCLPCKKCFHQIIPLFDPSHSSSYNILPCRSIFCKSSKHLSCDKDLTCEYDLTYVDGSHTSGNLASETITLGSTSYSVSLPNIVFGCGHNNGGLFNESESGIIGLGRGKLSLISQMGQPLGKKFSYCLIPSSTNSTGKISFGKDALVSGSGVISTPIATKGPGTFYYLTLEAISVGTERIAFTFHNNVSVEGNIIVDCGTTLNLVPNKVLDDLVSALDKIVRFRKAKDPNGVLRGCYRKRVGEKHRLPIMTAHFKGGDVVLDPLNMIVRVKHDVVCLAMIAHPDIAIYGNIAQMDFLIGFDLEAGTVSFKPTDCANEH